MTVLKNEEITSVAKEIIFDADIKLVDVNGHVKNSHSIINGYAPNKVETGWFNVDGKRHHREENKDYGRVSINPNRLPSDSERVSIDITVQDSNEEYHHAEILFDSKEQVQNFCDELLKQFEIGEAIANQRSEYFFENGSTKDPDHESWIPTYYEKMKIESGKFFWSGTALEPISKLPKKDKDAYWYNDREIGNESAKETLANLDDPKNEHGEMLKNLSMRSGAAFYSIHTYKVRREDDKRKKKTVTSFKMSNGEKIVMDGKWHESRGRLTKLSEDF